MSSDKSSHLSEPQPPGEVAADSSQGSRSWGVMRRASILHGRFWKMTCDPGSHCGRGNAAGPGPPSPQLLIRLSWGRAPSRQAPNVRAVSNSNSWRAGTLHSLPPLGPRPRGWRPPGGWRAVARGAGPGCRGCSRRAPLVHGCLCGAAGPRGGRGSGRLARRSCGHSAHAPERPPPAAVLGAEAGTAGLASGSGRRSPVCAERHRREGFVRRKRTTSRCEVGSCRPGVGSRSSRRLGRRAPRRPGF